MRGTAMTLWLPSKAMAWIAFTLVAAMTAVALPAPASTIVAGPATATSVAEAAGPSTTTTPTTEPDRPLVFADAAEERRFRELVLRLRCVMCQNQSLADSDAMIARDLRAQILAMMRAGRSDPEIEAFLVERYSDFVLYRPQVQPRTWLLWFGPALLLLAGALWVAHLVRRQARAPSAPPSDEQEW